jgi:hypothetical protein
MRSSTTSPKATEEAELKNYSQDTPPFRAGRFI